MRRLKKHHDELVFLGWFIVWLHCINDEVHMRIT
jgi:hypothetical protein